jgi:WD40 repeat protein
MAQCGNQLYSSSNKSLKIWDFENMQIVSDIQAHNGFIRCLEVSADQKIVTASDKTINLWDRYSLT